MELGKSLIIGVGLNDFQDPPVSEHVFAEVVLINQEIDGLHPLLYQLKRNDVNVDLFSSPSSYLHLPEDAFVMIGSVVLIDKKKKQILIKNKNDSRREKTVSYRHLIISSKIGPGSQQDEFSIALHALMEAQKIQKNTNKTLHANSAKALLTNLLNRAKKQENNASDPLFSLPQSFHTEDQKKASTLTPDKRLYEVQL